MTLRFGLADPRSDPSNRVSVAPAPVDDEDDEEEEEEKPPPLPLELSYSPDCKIGILFLKCVGIITDNNFIIEVDILII